jgi:hypothetical protein
MTKFDLFINSLKTVYEAAPPPPGGMGGEDDSGGMPPEGGDMGDGSEGDMGGMEDTAIEPVEPVPPEELELAKLAVRALYFNAGSKDMHTWTLKYHGHTIPFEKISDFFEQTKKILPVLGFVERVMDHYEGSSSKWSEKPEVKGKGIIEKIRAFNAVAHPDEKLDNGKRLYWTRIILNCLIDGNPDFNLTIADVTEENLPEIFNMLKQHFGRDTRGMTPPGMDLRSPGNF